MEFLDDERNLHAGSLVSFDVWLKSGRELSDDLVVRNGELEILK